MNDAPTTSNPADVLLWEGIPVQLQARLDALRGVLMVQGVVQLQTGHNRRIAYRLRYRAVEAVAFGIG